LIAKRIGHIGIQACAHKDYLERKGLPEQAQDLLAHDLIAGDQNREVDLGFEAQGFPVEDLHFAFRSDDLIAQWAAVKAGSGIGFLPDYLVRNEPTVKVVLPFLEMPHYPVWLTVHRELQTSARIRAIYDFLASQVPLCLQSSP
jgi:DNA-binding transcriptional LysR family regulator